MDNSVNFARRFAHLVWLIIHEPANVDEQKGTLRALAAQAKDGAYHIGVHPTGLTANDQVVPIAFTGASDLLARMEEHGLVLLSTDVDATPADLLAVARILASPGQKGDSGAAAEAKRMAASATTVRFATRPRMANDLTRATPRAMPSVPIDIDFGEIYDDPVAEAMSRATPRSAAAIPTPSKAHDTGGLFAQFSTSAGPAESYTELIEQFDRANDLGTIDRVLEGLLTLAERAAQEGRHVEVTDILCAITNREQSSTHELKRTIAVAYRRMAKPAMLRAVAIHMAAVPERRTDCVALLTRAGEEGADALVELISDPAFQRDRRLYFDVLVQLDEGVPALLHMLSDPRWFVVRNAAELLGEMQVRDAEQPLVELLQHGDERVRRAANDALMRLGTQRAMQKISEALVSQEPELRIEAAAALANRTDAQAVPTLLKALDAERDEDVQRHLMLALGRHGTPEALKRLITAAAAERGIFKRKSTAFRVASVQGLAESTAPEAREALRALLGDKEPEVSNAAMFSLRRISRGDTRATEP
jgi:HEAT repeat protein